jgi:phosphoglucosamine mutase
MSKKYFGTDGIRGESGGPIINPKFAYQLGYAVGQQLKAEGQCGGRICIGRDPRNSGEALRDGIAAGFQELGFQPVDLGILPTPAISLHTLQTEAILGVVLTASHNPAKDNGFKFFQANGRKVTPEWESFIEERLDTDLEAKSLNEAMHNQHEAAKAGFLKHFASIELDLSGLQIVVDTSCGATCATTPAVLKSLGAEVIPIGADPDGDKINNGIGSEHPEKVIEMVKAGNGQLGLAHDGDGDRVIFCDEDGVLLTGDEFLGILALHRKAANNLPGDSMVGTILCNAGLESSLKKHDIHLHRTDVGDRNVSTEMIERSLTFGGEPSGHYVLRDQLPTGCGLHAAIELLSVIKQTGKPLTELRKDITLFPQITKNLQVLSKPALETITGFPVGLKKIEDHLEDQGRILVRYSGTENKVRLLSEAVDLKLAQSALNALEYLVQKYLPVTPPPQTN